MIFSNDWFKPHIATWNALVPTYAPRKVLEVGSFEGQSICHLIQLLGNQQSLEITCLDTWSGGQEHAGIDMSEVERRFDANVAEVSALVGNPVQVRKLKATSLIGLSVLLSEGRSNHFDMVYIDGSHETPDVLADAVLGFRLLRPGGLMIFDDYLWGQGPGADPLMNPKLAIDAFMNCFQRKLQPHPWMPNMQMYCRKLSD